LEGRIDEDVTSSVDAVINVFALSPVVLSVDVARVALLLLLASSDGVDADVAAERNGEGLVVSDTGSIVDVTLAVLSDSAADDDASWLVALLLADTNDRVEAGFEAGLDGRNGVVVFVSDAGSSADVGSAVLSVVTERTGAVT